MRAKYLHVMFGHSAGATLRKTLKQVGIREKVIAFGDDFSLGPIGTAGANPRIQWFADVMGYDFWDEVIDKTARNVADTLQSKKHPVVWFSRRDAAHYCGFLEWLWRVKDADLAFDVVDLTDVKVLHRWKDGREPSHELAITPSFLHPEHFLESGLLGRAAPLNTARRENYRQQWERLRDEDAPLRILQGLDLISAPINHFDAVILSRATREWQRFYRLVGEVLAAFVDEPICQGGGDMLLASRIVALIKSGLLEVRGDTRDIIGRRTCDVRLTG